MNKIKLIVAEVDSGNNIINVISQSDTTIEALAEDYAKDEILTEENNKLKTESKAWKNLYNQTALGNERMLATLLYLLQGSNIYNPAKNSFDLGAVLKPYFDKYYLSQIAKEQRMSWFRERWHEFLLERGITGGNFVVLIIKKGLPFLFNLFSKRKK